MLPDEFAHFELMDVASGFSDKERASLSQDYRDYCDYLASIGIRENFYIYKVMWDTSAKGVRFVHWKQDAWKAFNESGSLLTVLQRMWNSTPLEAVRWSPPKIIVSQKHAKLYELLNDIGHSSELSVRFADTPNVAAGVSFCTSTKDKIGKDKMLAAIGAAKVFHDQVLSAFQRASRRRIGLTETEEKYLELVYRGHSRKAICDYLKVSPNWVAKTFVNIRRKLDVSSDTEAMSRAIDLKIVG